MGSFGKKKFTGLKFARTKRSRYLLKGKKRIITFTPGKSPFYKKPKILSPLASASIGKKRQVKSTPTKISKKRLLYSCNEDALYNNELMRKNSTLGKTLETEVTTFSDFDSAEIASSWTFKMPLEILADLEASEVNNTEEENPVCSPNLTHDLLLETAKVDSSQNDTPTCSSPVTQVKPYIPQEILTHLEATEIKTTQEKNHSEPKQDKPFAAYALSEDILSDLECQQIDQDVEYEDCMEYSNVQDATSLQRELMDLLPSVISEFELNGKRNILQTFFKLVARNEFPFDNIAFLLWCDVVRWYSNSESRQMRYSPECLQFFWVGQKLFGGRFVRFMSGMKNEEEFLRGETVLDPQKSRLNFACPSENVLREVNPIGSEMPVNYKPGILEPVIELKANRDDSENSYILMLDGKKIKRGTDVNLLGFEKNETLTERINEKERTLSVVRECTKAVTRVQQKTMKIEETSKEDKNILLTLFLTVIQMFSLILVQVRKLRLKKNAYVTKLKEQGGDDWRKSKFVFSIDAAMTVVWKVDNLIDKIMKVIKSLCKTGAYLNQCGHLFADSDIVNLNTQGYVKFLKSPELLPPDTDTSLIKQRTARWYEDRQHSFVTGSSIYQAIGCDGLKRQKQHFDKVVNGIQPPEPTDVQVEAMKHGVESELHQIATMCGIIMPILYPDLTFYEEGYHYTDTILVSPDGSLQSNNGHVVYAFEGKAPTEKKFTSTLHETVPERYVAQTLFEQKAMGAEGTLYMSWTEQSCTVYKVLPDDDTCTAIIKEVSDVYLGDNVKKPTRLSTESKRIKGLLKGVSKKCVFMGEFPSVKGMLNENVRVDEGSPYLSTERRNDNATSFEYDELQRHLLAGLEIIEEAYEVERLIATQVVVYLLADIDRFWKQEEPHAVPVMYFYRGPSLPMDLARNITEKCKEVCKRHGLDVVACAADGEFTPLIVRGRNNNPLTQNQLSKDIWKEVNQLTKASIIKMMFKDTSEHIISTLSIDTDNNDNHVCIQSKTGALGAIKTPIKGWKKSKDKHDKSSEDEVVVECQDEIVVENSEVNIEHVQRIEPGIDDEHIQEMQDDEFSQICRSSQEPSYIDSQEIFETLRKINEKKWSNKTQQEINEYFTCAEKLQKLTVKELKEVTKVVNRGNPDKECLKVSGLKKHILVNQLSALFGDGSKMKEIRRVLRNPPSLKAAAQRIVMKRTYPKKVLNIAYCNLIWSRRVDEWKRKARVRSTVRIHGLERELEPYYVPDESVDGDFEVFVYDKTHLGSNLRKCLCLDKVEGVFKEAWNIVAEKEPETLNPALLEVNEEGKIVDQMRERLARNMVSQDVEKSMRLNNFDIEANFCKIVREGLYEADDKPGIASIERCEMRMALIQWLSEGIDFGDFPPYGSNIKGMSATLYEGLRSSNEAKLYLYAIAKKGTYNVRAPNTLCSESFFSTMQEMDAWGQGILTAEGIEKHISDFTTITALKMNEERNFYIRTKKDAAYPTQELEPSIYKEDEGTRKTPHCTCRRDRYIKCIVPRDHFFDTEQRARHKKSEKPYKFSGFNEPARGDLPVRQQYGYRINETKVLTSKRIGLHLHTD